MSLSEFEARLQAAVGTPSTPSVAYGIVRGDKTLLLGAAGFANRENQVAATSKTSYSQASITKPITATGVMLLAERGLVDLDAPIEKYLGGQTLTGKAGSSREATVRRVADHSAGLALHYQFYYADEPFARLPFAETVHRYGKLFSPPGERHQYSNLGYGLLDELISNVSGMPYERFMTEEIFEPLGMTGSSIGQREGAAIAYGPDVVYPAYDFDHPGGSAAYASVEDLLAFAQFHLGLGPDLFSLKARKVMAEPTIMIDSLRGYGFGWGTTDRSGRRIVQHTGGMGGVSTILRLVPELDLFIVVLVNGESDLPSKAADEALAILDPLPSEKEFPPPSPQPIPDDFKKKWSGVIETHEGKLPFILDLAQNLAVLNGQESALEELRWANGRLAAVFDGDVQTEDASRRPYRLHLNLGHSDAGLQGAVTAVTKPGGRLGNALSYWTELRS